MCPDAISAETKGYWPMAAFVKLGAVIDPKNLNITIVLNQLKAFPMIENHLYFV